MSNQKEIPKQSALNKVLEYSKTMYPLKCLTRYNTRHRIKDESVAEHLAFVTLIVLDLHRHYKFNLERAMVMAITHDLPELEISDVPHTIKKRYPNIGAALKESEISVWKEKFPDWADINFELMEGSCIEAWAVELADAVSCYQYATNEMAIGNKSMLDIHVASYNRCVAFKAQMEAYLRVPE